MSRPWYSAERPAKTGEEGFFASFSKKMKKRPFTSAVVAAGGSATRMGGINKLLEEIGGIPVVAYSLLALEKSECIDEIVIAASEENLLPHHRYLPGFCIHRRQKSSVAAAAGAESVYKALCECDSQAAFALVQDGARPLVTTELIDAVCEKGLRLPVCHSRCAGKRHHQSGAGRLGGGDAGAGVALCSADAPSH